MNSSPLVCVTGASGFIASHLVGQLLAGGYRVRGTVRGSASDYPLLTGLEGGAERLELATADLLEEGSFDEAVAGCACVMHTASPYVIDVSNPQRDLVDPAVQGTLNVLAACRRSNSVQRVVLTSSVAAITDSPRSDHVYTEADWNGQSSLDRNPYYFSKVQAERAAWEFVKTGPGFDLVVVNPFVVIGPSLSKSLNTSNDIFVRLLSGRYPAVMRLNWGMVDVRDVAAAHVRAGEARAASGRYLCAAETISMQSVVELLRSNGYDEYRLPKLNLANAAGDILVKLMSFTQPSGVGTYLRTHVGRDVRFDNGKIRRELGIEFRPLADSILETAADLKKWQHV